MLFVQNGEGVQIDSAPTIERERDDLILSLKARGFGLRKIADVINRSHMYVKRRLVELRESAEYEVAASQADDERLGPPGSVPWFGANPAWSPRVEQSKGTNGTNGSNSGNGSKAKVCRKCGKDLGPIQHNSVFVCLACTRTCRDQAIENELRRERIVKEEAEQREAERRATELEERRASRRDRKKANKASKSKRDK